MKVVLYDDDYDYVEGYYFFHGMPIEHAWVINKTTGEHIDCTMEDTTEGRYLGLIYPKRLIDMVMKEGFCDYRGSMYDTICTRRLSGDKLFILKELLDSVN